LFRSNIKIPGFMDRQRFEKYLIIESVNRILWSAYLIIKLLAQQDFQFRLSNILVYAAMHLILSIIILFWKRLRNMIFFSLPAVITLIDILYISYAISHTGLEHSHSYLLYILPITFWGIRCGIRGSTTISSLVSILYLAMVYIHTGQLSITVILRVAFFIYLSLYTGLLCDKTHKNMYSLATKDGLTSLYNQKYFYDSLNSTLKQALKNQQPVSIALLDLDNFKVHNDQLGHLRGDELLKKVSRKIKENIRSTDIAARYGGDEFVVIFPNTTCKDTIQVAERIRRSIEKDIKVPADMAPLSVSIGIAVFPKDGLTPCELFDAADKSLYLAKNRGKNIVMHLSQANEA